jgi:hypothetical protein
MAQWLQPYFYVVEIVSVSRSVSHLTGCLYW